MWQTCEHVRGHVTSAWCELVFVWIFNWLSPCRFCYLLYFVYICWLVPVVRQLSLYSFEYSLESVEKYSEAEKHKSEPEPRNGKLCKYYTVYFYLSGKILESVAEFVYDKQACDCQCLLYIICASSLE